MNARAKKILLLLLAAALVFGSSRIQQSLNGGRGRLGVARAATLDNAPPVLAFTTIALGGFRGLISNFLWIRANDLQQDDKFFEAAQLANWITDLEPHFTQVWLFQSWNMAYNISVKFKANGPGNYADRWRWVENGVNLLRDQGLKYNPDEPLIYRELGWFFQHKMGANLDDANMYYKAQWAQEMDPIFGAEGTNYLSLITPQTDLDRSNAMVLRDKYKMDPAFIKEVDDKYGPLDWRLPEAHAIYWGAKGLQAAKDNPEKVKKEDIMTLRRIIYQSIYQAFKHGRILINPITQKVSLVPDLALIGRVNEAYTTMADEDPSNRDQIERAQRNFLRDAIYFLYEDYRMKEANYWFKYLAEHFPNKPIIDDQPNSLPRNMTLDEYAVTVIQENIGETSQEKVTAAVEGLVLQSFVALAQSDDDRYQNFANLGQRVYDVYVGKTRGFAGDVRIPLPSMRDFKKEALDTLLDPQSGLPPEYRAILRTRLGLPAESAAPAESATNAVPAISTNAVPAAITNPPAQ